MAIPGTPGVVLHRRRSDAQRRRHSEQPVARSPAAARQAPRKLVDHDYGAHGPTMEGEGDAPSITFGSATPPVREALARVRGAGRRGAPDRAAPDCAALPERLARRLTGVTRVLVVEQNTARSCIRYLRAHRDLPSAGELPPPGTAAAAAGELAAAIARMERAALERNADHAAHARRQPSVQVELQADLVSRLRRHRC
jgi:hypothetical protein